MSKDAEKTGVSTGGQKTIVAGGIAFANTATFVLLGGMNVLES